MHADDADTCIHAVLIRWRYQPMATSERVAWKRYLQRTVTLEEFGQALDIAVAQGGSQLANQPNQRPAVAEFAGIVNLVRRKRRTSASPEPWPDVDPAEVRRHIAAIRASVPALASSARRP